MKIDIIGAGICGLTTALALEKRGFKPNIYEQAKLLKPVGAGIILASNAMQVYKHLGIYDQLKASATPLDSLNITKPDLKVISRINFNYFKEKYNLQSVAIHRGKLQQILLENLHHTKIYLDYELQSIIKQNEGYRLSFKNEKSITSNIILGADGINSRLRKSLFPNSIIRSTDQMCWRGVTNFELPIQYKNNLYEAWGKESRFAFVQLNTNQIYWYAVKTFKNDKNELSKDKLSHYFRDYAAIIQKIIHATPLDTLHTTVIEDLKPIYQWHDNHICLIGDAAHATTPNMGQGACQSIEDAYAIAEYLKTNNVTTAFEKYQNARISNAHRVVYQSWQIGKVSHWKNPIGTFFRNTLLRLTPERVNQLQLEKLFELQK
ncbi:FAD-dependent monooxygenase [Aquimarina algicola]|uniref:Monooxygenase n=1 Tax=Aquimarina algicola TaxID=2589995 RepID=A0A504J8L3_9FLAO|nr:FAD-dependent monooxygenase [Aquimarina algicola]TPN86924.1 monooxygenase [Aquimarina algicola]